MASRKKNITLKFKTLIKKMRLEANLTQQETADKLNYKRNRYLRIENIASTQKITLEEARDILEIHNHTFYYAFVTFLEPERRDAVSNRLTKTLNLLKSLQDGTITQNDIDNEVSNLIPMYSEAMEVFRKA